MKRELVDVTENLNNLRLENNSQESTI